MPFPDVERVVYGRNPLDQVITQFQFPPILRIDAASPADFQDQVREFFPAYAESSELSFQFPVEVEGESPSPLTFQLPQSLATKNHAFASEDGIWKINLTRTFMALSTKDYSRWDDFKDKLAIPLDALNATYSPASYSRIGLRYINVICQSMVEMKDQPWIELIKPHILGMMAAPQIGLNVRKFQSRFEVELSDGESLARIRTGFVQSKDTGEICYRLDNDLFYGKKIDIGEAADKLKYLHNRSRRLFRWSITDRLHEAMEPVQA